MSRSSQAYQFEFEPEQQLHILDNTDLADLSEPFSLDFQARLAWYGWPRLQPSKLHIFQINLGLICNMNCRHCHVNAGPDRTETMSPETAQATLQALDQSDAQTVDLTGGAPEIQPAFPTLVEAAIERGYHVIDRCNLSVLLLEQQRHLPQWLAERGVEIVASLPHFRARNTDALRGEGAFEQSIEGLRRLNAAGYGQGDPARTLTLMTNPTGAFLAGDQTSLEKHWQQRLQHEHQITFDRLIALNNMPISRFLQWLIESGNLDTYMKRLSGAFNPKTVVGLMCRNTISVGWDGRIFDCDFNQMLALQSQMPNGQLVSVHNYDPEQMNQRCIKTARHCYGCTAGAGSSCSGATSS